MYSRTQNHDGYLSTQSTCGVAERDDGLLDDVEKLNNFNLFSSTSSLDELMNEIPFETPCRYSSSDSSCNQNSNKSQSDCFWTSPGKNGWLKERLEIDIDHNNYNNNNNNKTSFPPLTFVSPSSVFSVIRATTQLSRHLSFDSTISDNSYFDNSNDVVYSGPSSTTASEGSCQRSTLQHLFPPGSDESERGKFSFRFLLF